MIIFGLSLGPEIALTQNCIIFYDYFAGKNPWLTSHIKTHRQIESRTICRGEAISSNNIDHKKTRIFTPCLADLYITRDTTHRRFKLCWTPFQKNFKPPSSMAKSFLSFHWFESELFPATLPVLALREFGGT